jgi:hypothetical protein
MGEDKENPKQIPQPKLTGGLILILLGVLFLLTEMGRISWMDWWAYFLVGLGGIFILEVIIRAVSGAHGRGITGRLTAGLVLIFIGGAYLLGLEEWWPLILIAVGAAVINSSFFKKS